MFVLVLLGRWTAVLLHALFFEVEMGATVAVEEFEEHAIRPLAIPIVEGKIIIVHHIEKRLVLIVNSPVTRSILFFPLQFESFHLVMPNANKLSVTDPRRRVGKSRDSDHFLTYCLIIGFLTD